MDDIRGLVRRALQNARENGYTFVGETDEQVAVDLGTCDADLEGREPEELVEFVREWRKENPL